MTFINGEHISIILFFIGLFGLIARRQIVKTIISIGIMESAVILFFLSIGRWQDQVPPIGDAAVENMVDPLPQALMITAIVIGVAITAATLTLYMSLNHQHGTTDWLQARLLQEQHADCSGEPERSLQVQPLVPKAKPSQELCPDPVSRKQKDPDRGLADV